MEVLLNVRPLPLYHRTDRHQFLKPLGADLSTLSAHVSTELKNVHDKEFDYCLFEK